MDPGWHHFHLSFSWTSLPWTGHNQVFSLKFVYDVWLFATRRSPVLGSGHKDRICGLQDFQSVNRCLWNDSFFYLLISLSEKTEENEQFQDHWKNETYLSLNGFITISVTIHLSLSIYTGFWIPPLHVIRLKHFSWKNKCNLYSPCNWYNDL